MGCFKSIIICVLQEASLLPALAQVSFENYVQTSTRISDTQMQTVTQYDDGLGRPTEKVEHGGTPGRENLVHLQEYDGLSRDWRSWLPVKTSSSFLGRSDVASLSQRQYADSHAYSASIYDGSPLNRVVEVDSVGEDWSKHPVRTDFLINTTSFPLDCEYYRVSMQGELQYKGYYPEGRLKITKTTDEDGHESYEFKNLSDRVVLRRTMLSEKDMKFGRSEFRKVLNYINGRLTRWVMRKYKRFSKSKKLGKAYDWLVKYAEHNRTEFSHWAKGFVPYPRLG